MIHGTWSNYIKKNMWLVLLSLKFALDCNREKLGNLSYCNSLLIGWSSRWRGYGYDYNNSIEFWIIINNSLSEGHSPGDIEEEKTIMNTWNNDLLNLYIQKEDIQIINDILNLNKIF